MAPPPAAAGAAAGSQTAAATEVPRQGRWLVSPEGSPGPAVREAPGDVQAVPYLQGYKAAQVRPVVIEHDPEATFQGLNLYVSGHGAEAVLMGIHGRTRHRWRLPLRRLWPDLARDPEMAKLEYWRRAYLYPNGDLLAIYEGLGLVKLDAQSRILWANRGGFHHDLFVTKDGTIYVLDREAKIIPRINPRRGVFEEFVTQLDPAGRLLRKISILESFERSPYASLLGRARHFGDILHTNTVEVLDGRFANRHPAFRQGNVLISVRELNTIAVLDPERRTVVWAMTGPWRRQHQPTFLDNGHLLLFDNLGADRTEEHSRVLELDPVTGEILWQSDGRKAGFFSKTLGSCQRLPNGNTLITDSHTGRALEVTRDGRIVWEFNNPHRAGARSELVAALFEMVRLGPDFPFRG